MTALVSSYKLKITLKGSKPPIDRTVLVPTDITIEDLAGIITASMGWDPDGEYCFLTPWQDMKEIMLCSDGWESRTLVPKADPRSGRVSDLEGKKVKFLYALECEWAHEIVFQKPKDDAPDHPVLVKGRGRCPSSDCSSLHDYYGSFGQDSYAPDWEGHDEPLDEDFIEACNRYFQTGWGRKKPLRKEKLDAKTIGILITAMADVGTDYVFDAEKMKVLPIGDGEDEVPRRTAKADPEKYIPVETGSSDFPYNVASNPSMKKRYKGRAGDAESYRRFVDGLKGEDLADYDSRIRIVGYDKVRDWANRNRFEVDHMNFLLENHDVLEMKLTKSVMDVLDMAKKHRDEKDLSSSSFLCPKCGAECKAKLDKTQSPDQIGGMPRYPAVIRCGNCGRSTTLRLLNDGFNKGYTYEKNQSPASCMREAVRLSTEASAEKDPVRKSELLTDLAMEYFENRDLEFVKQTLLKTDSGKFSKSRASQVDPARRVCVSALWAYLGEGPKDVRQHTLKLKASSDSLKGRGGALLTACFCGDSKNRDACIGFHDRTMELAAGCVEDDYTARFSESYAAIHLYINIEGQRDRAVKELMEQTRRLADIMEESDFASKWAFLFSWTYRHAMVMGWRAGMTEDCDLLSSEMCGRFCGKEGSFHGGLSPIVAYDRAAFLMNSGGDKEEAKELYRRISLIVKGNMDNGPFTMDRFIVSEIMLMFLGESSSDPESVVGLCRNLGLSKSATAEVISLFIIASKDILTTKETIDRLDRQNIVVKAEDIDRIDKSCFNPEKLWTFPTIRPLMYYKELDELLGREHMKLRGFRGYR